MHSAAFLDDGLVYTWGQNDSGQLGNFTRDASEYPGIVDEEYIALGNYDIVLDDEQDAKDVYKRQGYRC